MRRRRARAGRLRRRGVGPQRRHGAQLVAEALELAKLCGEEEARAARRARRRPRSARSASSARAHGIDATTPQGLAVDGDRAGARRRRGRASSASVRGARGRRVRAAAARGGRAPRRLARPPRRRARARRGDGPAGAARAGPAARRARARRADLRAHARDRVRPRARRSPCAPSAALLAAEKLVVATTPGRRRCRSCAARWSSSRATSSRPRRSRTASRDRLDRRRERRRLPDDGRLLPHDPRRPGRVRQGHRRRRARRPRRHRATTATSARRGRSRPSCRRYYPALADVPIEHDWGGPIDRTPNSVPILGTSAAASTSSTASGGAATAWDRASSAGAILASLALGRDDEWSRTRW